MSKVVWKGSISFGLISIPIHMHSAIQPHVVGFHILHNVCHTQLKYQRWCPHCKKIVEWADVIKGIKLPNGKYFLMTPENLKKLKPERTDEISITEFIDKDQLEPIYYSNHYYLTPESAQHNKAFFLFLVALKHSGKIAIGTFVMRDKEYVCSIAPYESLLLLSTLNYEYEIRDIEKLKTARVPKANQKELELAQELMKRLYSKTFSIADFKDTFFQKVERKLKEQERKGPKKVISKPQPKKIKASSGPTLLTALQASLHKKSAPKAKGSR